MALTNGHKIEVKQAGPKSIEPSLSHKEEQSLAAEPLRVESTAFEFNPSKRKRRRWLCGCCISCGVFVIVLAIVIVVLVFTVFKAKDPKITLNSIKIGDVKTNVEIAALTVHLNLTLTADMSIKNTNKAASFKHANSTTMIMYQGKTVGEAIIPAGKLKADQTSRMNVSVTVFLDTLVTSASQLIGDVFRGSLSMTTRTQMTGRVTILHLVKKHVNVKSVCNVTVDLSSLNAQLQKCKNSYKL